MSRLHLALLLAVLLCACGSKPGATSLGQPPVILISIDTLRADRLPAYGYSKIETPALERLRRDGLLFENAYSHVPLTLPSHASLFTGLLPPEHGLRDNLGYRLDGGKHPSLADLLKQRGYATGGGVSAWVLRKDTGIAHGFDFWEDSVETPVEVDAAGNVQRPGGTTLDLVLPWLDRVQAKPFFLFFHIYEPHSPFDPPEPFKSRYADPYDGDVAAADAVIGRLLAELDQRGLYESSLIALVSDHGEGLGDHGEEFHGILLYREVLHVPLMLKLPGRQRAGERVAQPVELIDVLPTLAQATGAPLPEGLRGRSLLEPRQARPVYAETYYPRVHLGWSELRSVTDERWHYIESPRSELYDIVADPRQAKDLIAGQGSVARSLRTALSRFPLGFAGPADATPEEMEKLAALGYLGGGGAAGSGPLPNPRDRIHVLEQVKLAFRLSSEGRDAEAVAALQAILKDDPQFMDVLFELGRVLARMGRSSEAYDAFKRAMRTSPSMAPSLALPMARVCLDLGRWDEAEQNARLGQKTNPGVAHEVLARVALARDRLDVAERELEAVSGDKLAVLNASVLKAELLIRRQQFAQALAQADGVAAGLKARGEPLPRDLEFLRGDALANLGRHAEAAAAFEREIAAHPSNAKAYARLAIVWGIQRRTYGEVYRLLDRMLAANPSPQTVEVGIQTLEIMGDTRGAAAWRKRAQARPAGR